VDDEPCALLKGMPMNWNRSIRTIHRWTSITFAVALVTYIVAGGRKELAFWLGLFALVPLIVLLVTGLYMFFLPYVSKWRGGRADVLGN
jgi:uncharacterized iron-regulated membrane protein